MQGKMNYHHSGMVLLQSSQCHAAKCQDEMGTAPRIATSG